MWRLLHPHVRTPAVRLLPRAMLPLPRSFAAARLPLLSLLALLTSACLDAPASSVTGLETPAPPPGIAGPARVGAALPDSVWRGVPANAPVVVLTDDTTTASTSVPASTPGPALLASAAPMPTGASLVGSVPLGVNQVRNPGFELRFLYWTRRMSGYGVDGDLYQSIVAAASDPHQARYVATFAQHPEPLNRSGAFGATLVQTGASTASIAQDVLLPTGGAVRLRYWIRWRNAHPFLPIWVRGEQEQRVMLRDPATDSVLTEVFSTVTANSPSFSGGGSFAWAPWEQHEHDLTPWAGQRVRLSFELVAGAFYNFMDLDDIAVVLENRPPVVSAIAPVVGAEDEPVRLEVTASDPDGEPLTYHWDLLGEGAIDTVTTTGSVTLRYPDSGTPPTTVTVRDQRGGAVTHPIQATLSNRAPTATLVPPPDTVAEGTAVTVGLVAPVDAPGDRATLRYRVDCGRGFGPLLNAGTLTCPGLEAGAQVLRVAVVDKDGGESIYAASTRVTNIAPILAPLLVPTLPSAVGVPVTLEAAIDDPGPEETFRSEVQWDLGQPFVPGDPIPAGSRVARVTTTQLPSGVYTVTLRVADQHGAVAQTLASSYLVVYDASAGHVTGGGWISSPAGALLADPTQIGKAHFGFTAKYSPGASRPDGSTEFQFQAGGFRFRSTHYEWLVVAGARAQYKGEGTVNGQGDYGFLLTAIDGARSGAADEFRIKIWRLDTPGREVVYDNQRGAPDDSDAATALGGGSIVIHR